MAIRKDVATVLRELSKKSGIHEDDLSKRFHQIKSRGTTPGPKDINWIDDISGDVLRWTEWQDWSVYRQRVQ
jgi:hypothetical protein